MEGWIKLHRQIKDHWLWENPDYLKAWITILFTVNYETKKVLIKGDLLTCERGQSLLSLDGWVGEFGHKWSIQRVRTFFKLLKSDEMITVEGLQYTTRLTVCKYDTYQDLQQTANTPLTDRQQTANTPLTTTKEREEREEGKERKEKKRKTNVFVAPTVLEVIYYFKEKGYTEHAAVKAFDYYDIADWYDSKGNKVYNWKQKMQAVWFKDENKDVKLQPKRQTKLSY